MASAIGPFDGRRARRTRCSACVKRKIKCHGGIPCRYCQHMKQICEAPMKPSTFVAVFVGETAKQRSGCAHAVPRTDRETELSLSKSITLAPDDSSATYFFTSFLAMNDLSHNRLPVVDDLLCLMRDAPVLRDAISAIAIHHRKQQRTGALSRCEDQDLRLYGRSVRFIKDRIASNTFAHDPSALWTTFFLGLYELMQDSTGTSWVSHFLHGTCAMLQSLGPECLTQGGLENSHRRIFFLNTRIFEVSRSLIYSSPTFLWDSRWITSITNFWDGDSSTSWHPKEALLDILPAFSELSVRALHFALQPAEFTLEEQAHLTQTLADEGFVLQKKLQQWYMSTTLWSSMSQDTYGSPTSTKHLDTELMISYAYYHAINIYLSGTYDYHTQWTDSAAPAAPILTRGDIEWHVSQILCHSRALLACGVSGIFLLFPLRVAGARAVAKPTRLEIIDLFMTTSRRGFVVAEALVADLSELWG